MSPFPLLAARCCVVPCWLRCWVHRAFPLLRLCVCERVVGGWVGVFIDDGCASICVLDDFTAVCCSSYVALNPRYSEQRHALKRGRTSVDVQNPKWAPSTTHIHCAQEKLLVLLTHNAGCAEQVAHSHHAQPLCGLKDVAVAALCRQQGRVRVGRWRCDCCHAPANSKEECLDS